MDNIFLFIQCLSCNQHYAYMFDPNRQNLLHLRSVPTSYFSLLNQSFVKNYHISIITMFEKQSMINRLSNPINRNRSAATISKVMSSNHYPSHIALAVQAERIGHKGFHIDS